MTFRTLNLSLVALFVGAAAIARGWFGADWPILVLLGILLGTALLLNWLLRRSWWRELKQMEGFISAWPGPAKLARPVDASLFQGLTRALEHTAEQVRTVIQQANTESARRQTILAGMAEGVLAVDKGLCVIFCNDAFARAFNTRTPVIEGTPLYEVVREPQLRDLLRAVVREGRAAKGQLQFPTADGHWFEAYALPLATPAQTGAVVVLHDISDIYRQEQARKDFVANVSHELRTPLAAIRGYAETLLDGGLEDTAHNRQFVEVILAHAIRLNNIATDLLVLSELDSDTPALPPDAVPVLEVIESAVRTVESAAALRGVSLRVGDCRDSVVVGWRFRLEQALTNLLDNAVKFNKADGQVTIECGLEGEGRAWISVADTGIGIPKEDLHRVFERFYRVDKARSRRVGGTGLGLPIVKEMVERMGGAITVESQLGQGTRFTLHLIAEQPAGTAQTAVTAL